MKPVQSVAGVIFSHSQKEVLLIRRRDVPVWVLPGGGIDPGETPEHAIEREILEETGFTVKATRLVGDYLPLNRLARRVHLFACEIEKGEMTLSPETSGVAFFPLASLPPLPPPYLEWIHEALQDVPPIQRHLTSVNYKALFAFALSHPTYVARFLLSRLGLPINSK